MNLSFRGMHKPALSSLAGIVVANGCRYRFNPADARRII
jgi:hypothetical protein